MNNENGVKTARLNASVRRMAARGKTQREISDALGISQPTVSRILGRNESEDTPLLRMIARADRERDMLYQVYVAYHDGCPANCDNEHEPRNPERVEALWAEIFKLRETPLMTSERQDNGTIPYLS